MRKRIEMKIAVEYKSTKEYLMTTHSKHSEKIKKTIFS